MFGILWMVALTFPAAEPLTAGVATVDITPPVGFRMAGYFQERLSTGVHDPLQAKCVVFAQPNEVRQRSRARLAGKCRSAGNEAEPAASNR